MRQIRVLIRDSRILYSRMRAWNRAVQGLGGKARIAFRMPINSHPSGKRGIVCG